MSKTPRTCKRWTSKENEALAKNYRFNTSVCWDLIASDMHFVDNFNRSAEACRKQWERLQKEHSKYIATKPSMDYYSKSIAEYQRDVECFNLANEKIKEKETASKVTPIKELQLYADAGRRAGIVMSLLIIGLTVTLIYFISSLCHPYQNQTSKVPMNSSPNVTLNSPKSLEKVQPTGGDMSNAIPAPDGFTGRIYKPDTGRNAD